MKVLVVSSGSREHTLAWRLTLRHRCDLAPSNGRTSPNAPIQATDVDALAQLAAVGADTRERVLRLGRAPTQPAITPPRHADRAHPQRSYEEPLHVRRAEIHAE